MIKKIFYRNNLWFGALLGALIPLVTYFALDAGIEASKDDSGVRYLDEGTVQVVSIVFNVFLFRWYMLTLKFDETGKGMLLSTFIYAFFYVFKHMG